MSGDNTDLGYDFNFEFKLESFRGGVVNCLDFSFVFEIQFKHKDL